VGLGEKAQLGLGEEELLGFGEKAQLGLGEKAQPGSGEKAQPGSGEKAQPGSGEKAQPGSGEKALRPAEPVRPAGLGGFEVRKGPSGPSERPTFVPAWCTGVLAALGFPVLAGRMPW
jgi:hypothetical protein